jgi:tetratricopeptide (TPR) repeat protein
MSGNENKSFQNQDLALLWKEFLLRLSTMQNLISLCKFALGLLLILSANIYAQEKKIDVERCQKNDYDCYIESYDAQIKENSTDPRLYYKRGEIYSLRGNYTKAIADFTKVLELDPKYPDGYFARGYSYHSSQKYDLAINDYSEAIRLKPEPTGELVNRGMIYSEIKEMAKSKADFNSALEILNRQLPLCSKDYDLYLTRAVAFRELGEIDKSIADFYQSIQLNPYHHVTYKHRGSL